jgi:hypothetical protein
MKHASLFLLLALTLATLVACKSDSSTEAHAAPPAKAKAKKPVEAKKEAPKKPALPPCGVDDDGCRVERLGSTSVGWLSEGLAAKKALEKLGPPTKKEARFEEGASGDFLEIWSWPAKGVSLDVTAPNMTDPVDKVRGFTVSAPFKGETARGISLGSTEAEVRAAYADCLDPRVDQKGQSVVAGSIYGGMFFSIKDGQVSSIFVGAGAE